MIWMLLVDVDSKSISEHERIERDFLYEIYFHSCILSFLISFSFFICFMILCWVKLSSLIILKSVYIDLILCFMPHFILVWKPSCTFIVWEQKSDSKNLSSLFTASITSSLKFKCWYLIKLIIWHCNIKPIWLSSSFIATMESFIGE